MILPTFFPRGDVIVLLPRPTIGRDGVVQRRPVAAGLATVRPRSRVACRGYLTSEHRLGRMLDLAAGRVDDAEVLIDALGRLRTILDRYTYFCPTWKGGRQLVASTLHAN